jgi:phosphate transport system substrate-binding protein
MTLRVLFAFLSSAWLTVSAATLPVPENGPALRIQGSNTIGADLGPALVEGFLQEQGLLKVHRETPTTPTNNTSSAQTAQGQRVVIEVAAHGSSTGFTALKTASADLAASSRPIKDSELLDLEALGDLKSAEAEQVIAIDGLAIILHPATRCSNWTPSNWRGSSAARSKPGKTSAGTADPFICMRGMISPAPTTPSRNWCCSSRKTPEPVRNASNPASNCPMRSATTHKASVSSACRMCARPKPWRSRRRIAIHVAAQQPDCHRRLSAVAPLVLYLPPSNQNPWARRW